MICDCGKVRYLSRREARQSGRTIRGKRKATLRAYRCGGGFWHLTSQSTAKTTLWRAYS